MSVDAGASYEEKFSALNQQLRWEVADELRLANLDAVNEVHESVRPMDSFYVRRGKRLMDIGLSGVALVLTAPINAALFGITLVDLGRPVLFSQKRIGKDGGLFVITKLRTMRDINDDQGRPLLGQQRVTKLGRLVRRSSLDELLNFWSIFKGDMSVIGPRPLVPEYHSRFSRRHVQRHSVRPGLECPQRRQLDHAASYEEQFENDIWYVENVSLRTDLYMMFRVVQTALDRRQNKARGASNRGSFMGYDEQGHVVTTKNLPEWAIDRVLKRHGRLDESHVAQKDETETSSN